MTIHEGLRKIKTLGRILDKRDNYAVLIVICTAIGSFFLGKLSAIEGNRPAITIERGDWKPHSETASSTPIVEDMVPIKPISNAGGAYVGSKSGTKYHLQNCPGAKSIKEANKIWFSSKIEAEKAGYAPAMNCPGI